MGLCCARGRMDVMKVRSLVPSLSLSPSLPLQLALFLSSPLRSLASVYVRLLTVCVCVQGAVYAACLLSTKEAGEDGESPVTVCTVPSTETGRGREAERQRGREAERQRSREAERQRGREAERQRGREAEKQRDRERVRFGWVRQKQREEEGSRGRRGEKETETDAAGGGGTRTSQY